MNSIVALLNECLPRGVKLWQAAEFEESALISQL